MPTDHDAIDKVRKTLTEAEESLYDAGMSLVRDDLERRIDLRAAAIIYTNAVNAYHQVVTLMPTSDV